MTLSPRRRKYDPHGRERAAVLGFILKRGAAGATLFDIADFLGDWYGIPQADRPYRRELRAKAKARVKELAGRIRPAQTGLIPRKAEGILWVAIQPTTARTGGRSI